MRTSTIGLVAILSVLISACGPAIMYGPEAPEPMRSYEKIMAIRGKSKNEIFVTTNEWLVETFEPGEFYLEFQDKEGGKIMGQYVYTYLDGLYACEVSQTVDISIKEEKIRLQIFSPTYAVTTAIDQEYYGTHRPLTTEKGLTRAKSNWEWFEHSLYEKLTAVDEW